MSAAWKRLRDEIARWRDAGRAVDFWWRDDDAMRPDPALERLAALSARSKVPLSLAVIPQGAEPSLMAALGETVCVLQHGTDHRNRAAPGEKKTEYPAGEGVTDAMRRLQEARERLRAIAGARFRAVLAPPWNRFPGHLVARLPEAGFVGLSRFGPRKTKNLVEVNTHIDIIDWHHGRGFVGEDAALDTAVRHLAARREGRADPGEPTGWLTHHAVHDAAAWEFLERLFESTGPGSGVSWRSGEEIFHSP